MCRRLYLPGLILLPVLFTWIFPIACANNPAVPATPSPTHTPLPSLSAFATIGSSTYLSYFPSGIQYQNGHLWVADYSNSNLQEWVTNGSSPVTTITTFNGGAQFNQPSGISIDPGTGDVYVADAGYQQIEVFDSTGVYLTTFGHSQLNGGWAMGVAVNSAGTTVYALNQNNGSVFYYSITPGSPPTYTYLSRFKSLGNPLHLGVDATGNVWIPENYQNRVAEYSASGTFMKSFTLSGLPNAFSPGDLWLDGSGNVYALDGANHFVVEFNPSGVPIGQFGAGVIVSGDGLTSDGAGNFYVTDNNQILVFH